MQQTSPIRQPLRPRLSYDQQEAGPVGEVNTPLTGLGSEWSLWKTW